MSYTDTWKITELWGPSMRHLDDLFICFQITVHVRFVDKNIPIQETAFHHVFYLNQLEIG